jgi:proline iminopeptidase
MGRESDEGTPRGPFPAIEPYRSGFLAVDSRHTIYFEESGRASGKPVVVLHGGPGGGSNPLMRRLHDPAGHRIVLFDQRGCGRSTPHADLEDNTTWRLVDDMETLRAHLGVERWQVFGGSWGSTLALAYAATHPERVTELVLRGVFTLREAELRWFYQDGASWVFPDAWEAFLAPIPPAERRDLMAAYHRRLTHADAGVRLEAARAWSGWEAATLSLFEDRDRVARFQTDDYALAFARIECHYFVNRGFFAHDGWLLDAVPRFRHLPCRIVQGRYDVCTPARTAWELKARWPEAELVIVPDAGHAMTEPGILRELVRATEDFKTR